MGQLLVRGVEDEVIAALRSRAAANGRSVEAEHREILRVALEDPDERAARLEVLKRDLARLRAETVPNRGPSSTELVREDRDSR